MVCSSAGGSSKQFLSLLSAQLDWVRATSPVVCMVMGVSHLWFCVEVQWFCFGNVFGNHNDPKVQFTFSNLFCNTFEDLDDFKILSFD